MKSMVERDFDLRFTCWISEHCTVFWFRPRHILQIETLAMFHYQMKEKVDLRSYYENNVLKNPEYRPWACRAS